MTLNGIRFRCAQRRWECAERKIRGSSGIDAVAVLAVIQSSKSAFAPLTLAVLGVEGEHICKRLVELRKLYDELQDTLRR
ncbi:hypothetical protein DFH11DRAFT_1638992, partial [Phellopilus nigrolimitatus]